MSSISSASTRSWATANGPSCISNPISRSIAASIASGTAPAPWSASTSAAIRRSTPRRNVPVPDGRVGQRHVRRGQAVRHGRTMRVAQHLVHQADHRLDDLGRRVVRAGELAQRVVVDLQEVLVEVEPGVGLALADRRPVDGVEDARQRAERVFSVAWLSTSSVSRRRAAPMSELVLPSCLADLVEAVGQPDVSRPRHRAGRR